MPSTSADAATGNAICLSNLDLKSSQKGQARGEGARQETGNVMAHDAALLQKLARSDR